MLFYKHQQLYKVVEDLEVIVCTICGYTSFGQYVSAFTLALLVVLVYKCECAYII
jgi:hypothetical protein